MSKTNSNWLRTNLKSYTIKIGSGITPKGGSTAYVTQGVTFIRSQNVRENKLILDEVAFITSEQHNIMGNSKVRSQDVLLNITGASIGRSCVVPDSIVDANVNQHVCIIRCKDTLNPSFLCHYLNSQEGQKQIFSFQAGGNREGLNYEQIGKFLIPILAIEEQKYIAKILDTWSSATELLENLIAAKVRLKRGLAQQLLTGKKRFGEFANLHWKQTTFDQIFSDATEKNFKNEITNVITVGKYAIRPQIEHFYRSMASKNLSDYNIIKKGNFVYDPMSAYYGSFGRYELDDIGIVSPVYRVLNINNEISSEFIKHLIKSYQITYQIDSKSSQGNKPGKRRGISKEAFNSISVFLPPLEEQRKIADVLNACDKEIELLNKQLELVKKQKQGLMQKLLTGQIRVM